jgi:hypothetical protein
LTHQNPELFFYKGMRLQSYNQPLCSHPRLTELLMETPACVGGYGRTWSIENNKLYLVELKIHLENLSSEASEDGLFFADWFTGNINFGQGSMTLRCFQNTYEKYLSLGFDNGVLVAEQVLTHDETYPPEPEKY